MVPGGYSAQPPAGPILLERKAEFVDCGGEVFFITAVVHCFPSGANFTEPLVLDFVTSKYGDEAPLEGKYKVRCFTMTRNICVVFIVRHGLS